MSAENRARQSSPVGVRDRLRVWLASNRLFPVALLVGVASMALLISQSPQPCDDAYITFRHVKNIVQEGRPAWNLEGRPVLCSTAPAFATALALFTKASGLRDIPSAALYLNSLLLLGIVVLTYLFVKELCGQPALALLSAALVGWSSIVIYVSAQGFENPLLIVVLLSSLILALMGRVTPALVVTSIAPLVRPEGILISPLVWAYLLAKRRFRARHIVAFLALPLVWLIFATTYYGSPIPHSVLAKRYTPMVFQPYSDHPMRLIDQLPSPHTLWTVTRSLRQTIVAGPFASLLSPTLQSLFLGTAALAYGLTFLLSLKRRKWEVLLLAYPPLFIVLMAWLRSWNSWYLPSFVAFSIIGLAVGCATVADEVSRRAEGKWKARMPWRMLRATVLATIFVLFLGMNEYEWNLGTGSPAPWLRAMDIRRWEPLERERYDAYGRAAAFLNQRSDPGSRETAMINEVGYFGYYFNGEVIDSVGLCTPEALGFYPPPSSEIVDPEGNALSTSNNLIPSAMIRSLRPRYVVSSLAYIMNLVRPGSSFLSEYGQLGSSGRAFGTDVLLFERKPAR